jgi:hypothetical protein
MLTCQRIVKVLPMFCEAFNILVNCMTIQGIVITISYFLLFILYIFYYTFFLFHLLLYFLLLSFYIFLHYYHYTFLFQTPLISTEK